MNESDSQPLKSIDETTDRKPLVNEVQVFNRQYTCPEDYEVEDWWLED